MKQGIEAIREHLNITGVCIEEEAFLAGVICGIRTANMSESCVAYIEDLESHHILWISTPYLNRLCVGKTDQNLTTDTHSIYGGRAEQKQIAALDNCTLKFIQSIASSNIAEYIATSYVSIGGCIYERRISFLSMEETSAPRFMVCKLCISSHSHPSLPKVMRNGDSYYYRLKHAPYNWVKRELIKLDRREQLILILSAEGFREAEIATRIYISLPRLKSIKGAMFERLRVSNLCQAIRRAYSFGLIAPDLPLEE